MIKDKECDTKKSVLIIEEVSEEDEERILKQIELIAKMDAIDRYNTAIRIGKEKGLRKFRQKILVKGINKGRFKVLQQGEANGIKIGRQQGIEEGILLAKLDISINLLKIGMTVEQIAELTKLTVDQIREFIKKQN